MDNKELESALKEFLLDIDCLSRLEKAQGFNVFDVLKISRTEIRHSNVLAWLLDPKGNHGFGERILNSLNEYIVRSSFVEGDAAIKLLTAKYSDVTVYRELHDIDILIEASDDEYVICIENKVDTRDHDNQLDKYYNTVYSKYDHKYTKIFLYLTPDGFAPNQDTTGSWKCIKYETLIDIIEKELDICSINQEQRLFISDYLSILRREMMENTEIIELCQKIYKKHKVALDLIYDNRPDRLQNVTECFLRWGNEQNSEASNMIFCPENSSKSYCRFRTKTMDAIIYPTDTVSGWGTKNHYFYEIAAYLDKDENVRFWIQLSFSSYNLSEENRKQLEALNKAAGGEKQLKEGWQWRTVFKTKTDMIKADEELPDVTDKDSYICVKLNKHLHDALEMEKKIIERYSQL